MSNAKKLQEAKRQLHKFLILALNYEGGTYRPQYKVDFVGDMYVAVGKGDYHKVELSTSADLREHSVSIYLTSTDANGKLTVKELSMSEGMLNHLVSYNTLLYKQAIHNEQLRSKHELNSN